MQISKHNKIENENIPNRKGEIKHCFCGHDDLSLTLLNILWIHTLGINIFQERQLGNRPPNQRQGGD